MGMGTGMVQPHQDQPLLLVLEVSCGFADSYEGFEHPLPPPSDHWTPNQSPAGHGAQRALKS